MPWTTTESLRLKVTVLNWFADYIYVYGLDPDQYAYSTEDSTAGPCSDVRGAWR